MANETRPKRSRLSDRPVDRAGTTEEQTKAAKRAKESPTPEATNKPPQPDVPVAVLGTVELVHQKDTVRYSCFTIPDEAGAPVRGSIYVPKGTTTVTVTYS